MWRLYDEIIGKKINKYQNIGNLSGYVFEHRGKFAVSIVYGILEQIFTLVSLLIGAYLTGLAFTGATGGEIFRYFFVLLICIIAKGVFSYLHMYVCHEVAYMVLEDLRGDVYDALSEAAPYNSADYRTGDVSSIIMEDVETLEVFLAHIFGDYIIAAVCMILFTGIYAYFSLGAAAVSFAASLLILTIPYWFGQINERLGRELREGLGQTNAGIVDSIQGLDEILVFGAEKKFIDKMKHDTEKLNKIEVRDGNIKGLQAGLIGFVMSAVLVYVVLLANNRVLNGSLSPVFTGAFIVMSLNIFFPVVMVSQSAGKIDAAAAASNRVYALLSKGSPLRKREGEIQIKDKNHDKIAIDEDMAVSVRDVYFSYDKIFGNDDKSEIASNTVLKGVTLDIKKGENIVITGKSGAGKSTLVYLLMRFFDPDKGDVYLFGKNMRDMKPEDVRKNIAYVPQDVYIFHGTVMDNLRLGKMEASVEEVKEAAHIAVADRFISEMKNGYNSFIGERGITLSGGQKQRLAIARALLTGADIIVMDEAVSNLDSESEVEFRTALDNISKGKTIITIAHRSSTIMAAKRVVILEDGMIIVSERPEEWVRRNNIK